MKKLLFSGCSFMAGDEIAWEVFKRDRQMPHLVWRDPANRDLHEEYVKYRIPYTVPGVVASLADMSVTNIADDGNSNENIALSTITYLNQFTNKEARQYHVCVGWSVLARRLKWIDSSNMFLNLNIGHLDHPEAHPEQAQYANFIREALVNISNEDLLLKYFQDIMLLENYLKSRNISYTFWRSLGSVDECLSAYKFNELQNLIGKIDPYAISDETIWLKFAGNEKPWMGNSWGNILTEGPATNFVRPGNRHPSILAAKEFGTTIYNHLAKFL